MHTRSGLHLRNGIRVRILSFLMKYQEVHTRSSSDTFFPIWNAYPYSFRSSSFFLKSLIKQQKKGKRKKERKFNGQSRTTQVFAPFSLHIIVFALNKINHYFT